MTKTQAVEPELERAEANGAAPVEETTDEDDKVLDLTDAAPSRRLVKLPTKTHPEGERFEVRLMDDFGIAKQQQLLSWGRRYDALFNAEDDLDSDQQDKLKFYLDSIFDAVLDAPVKVKKEMPDAIRNRVVLAFTLAPLLARQDAQRREEEKNEQAQQTSTTES